MTTDTDFRKIIAEAFKNADAKPEYERAEYLIRELTGVIALKPDLESFNDCVMGNFNIRLVMNRAEWYTPALRVSEYMAALFTETARIKDEWEKSE
jgi:hypothetical protein